VRVLLGGDDVLRRDPLHQRGPGVELAEVVLGVGADKRDQRLRCREQQQLAAVAEEDRHLLVLLLLGLLGLGQLLFGQLLLGRLRRLAGLALGGPLRLVALGLSGLCQRELSQLLFGQLLRALGAGGRLGGAGPLVRGERVVLVG